MPKENTTIRGKDRPIRKVFREDYDLEIPPYQRPYSWSEEEAGDLFSDLYQEVKGSGREVKEIDPYFLGSLVLIKEEGNPKSEVVDGQQRLTTLTILFSALRNHVAEDYAVALDKRIMEEGDPLTDQDENVRLSIRERDRQFFKEHIQDQLDPEKLRQINPAELTDPQAKIRENALLYNDQLSDLSEEECVRLAKFILNRCFVVVVSTPTQNSAYRIFSILNDRGLDLSHSDILKARIIGRIDDQYQQAYTEKWEQMEIDLGRESFQDLFEHVRMINRKKKAQETILEEFEKYVQSDYRPRELIDELLMPYARSFDIIRNASYESQGVPDEVNRYLRHLDRIDNQDWVPPAMYFHRKNANDPEALKRFLRDLERLAAAFMIRRTYRTTRINRYGEVLEAIENDRDLYEEDSSLQLTQQEKEEVSSRLNGQIYGETKYPKYVLLRLDGILSDGEASYEHNTITIEHVLPQDPPEESPWIEKFSDQEWREKNVHRLGNLLLLSRRRNSSARNYPFEKKKEKYFDTRGSTSFALTTQVVNEGEWTPEIVEQRQQNMVDLLKQEWRLV